MKYSINVTIGISLLLHSLVLMFLSFSLSKTTPMGQPRFVFLGSLFEKDSSFLTSDRNKPSLQRIGIYKIKDNVIKDANLEKPLMDRNDLGNAPKIDLKSTFNVHVREDAPLVVSPALSTDFFSPLKVQDVNY